MVEPSRAGLTIIGAPSAAKALRAAAALSTSNQPGVGRPSARQMRLVITLSMAMLEAITPEPVYGMPSNSSAPCTVPSSPKRPCRAMKQRAKPSRFKSPRSRSDGSKGCASTPWLRSAASTPVPDILDTSRSADAPPISTATFPNAAPLRASPTLTRKLVASRTALPPEGVFTPRNKSASLIFKEFKSITRMPSVSAALFLIASQLLCRAHCR